MRAAEMAAAVPVVPRRVGRRRPGQVVAASAQGAGGHGCGGSETRQKKRKRQKKTAECQVVVMDVKTPQNNNNSGKKQRKRKEILERKKAIDELIKQATSVKDHLAHFPGFCKYERNGLSVYLESGCGDQLSLLTRKYIETLLKVNMEGPYGPEWPSEEKVKRREMVVPEARYIFVRKYPNGALAECSSSTELMGNGDHLLGFLHYRFVVEEDVPVVYVYELQLESSAQGKGLGKFLMQMIELIACKNKMGAVMLTVQKSNVLAMTFYTTKLRYVISSTSPSQVDPLIGAERSYEILCKTFDSEAKARLE